MMPRGRDPFEAITRRWSASILFTLHEHGGAVRFNWLLSNIAGISDRILTERLRELVALGLVDRDVEILPTPYGSVRITYALTAHGHGVGQALRALERELLRARDLVEATG